MNHTAQRDFPGRVRERERPNLSPPLEHFGRFLKFLWMDRILHHRRNHVSHLLGSHHSRISWPQLTWRPMAEGSVSRFKKATPLFPGEMNMGGFLFSTRCPFPVRHNQVSTKPFDTLRGSWFGPRLLYRDPPASQPVCAKQGASPL